MIRFTAVAISCLVVLSCAQFASADFTFGPFQDFLGHLDPSPAEVRKSTGGSHNGWDIKDNVSMVNGGSTGIDLRGAMFVTSQSADYSGDLVITTIYGRDGGSFELSVFGFDPVPILAALTLSDEHIVGNSGTEYVASVALRPTLAELPALLPGFDLSVFHGAPDSFFFMFQTTAPSSDIAPVPEPSSLTLLIAGTGVVLLARRRKFLSWHHSDGPRTA